MEHSDVFLSYRRKDVDFAKKLDQALKATGREVWVDWEDIPPGVEGFSDEIQRGIEGANALIAVLSPNYIESEYCLMELREALKLKKRVIPIVLEKFDPTPPPEGIGHINWVYFTLHAGQENKFEDAFKKVIVALEADYDHSREHTRLLLRALEWDKKARNASYILKGAEIDKAEGWQVAAASKDPSPTALQGEYILTSRKIQRRQQQRFMGIIGALLVVAAIAAVLAIFQAGEAQRQAQIALAAQAEAELNAEIAHSSALASEALQPGNESLSMALALEAVRSDNAPREGFQTLETIAYQPGSLRYERLPSSGETYPYIRYPAVDPAGRFAIAGQHRFDLALQEETVTFTDVPGNVFTGVYLPDGKRVILAGDDEGILNPDADPVFMGLYNAETGTLIHRFETEIGVSDIQLSGDGKTIISYLPTNKAVWWDIETGEKLREFDVSLDSPATFSPDLKWLAVISWAQDGSSAELSITEVDTNTVIHRLPVSFSQALRFSPDGSEIVVATEIINIYGVADGALIRSLSGHVLAVTSVRYSVDGSKLVTTSVDGEVIVWNREHGTIIAQVSAHKSDATFAEFVRGGDGVISSDAFGTLIEWDVKPGNLIHSVRLPDSYSNVILSQDGSSLFREESCDLVTWDVTKGEVASRFEITSQDYCQIVLYLDPPTGSASVLYAERLSEDSPDYDVRLIDSTTQSTRQTWRIPRFSFISRVMPLPDGQRLLIAYSTSPEDPASFTSETHVELWGITTGDILRVYEIPDNAALALSPDGSKMLVGARYYTNFDENDIPVGEATVMLAMYDVATGEVLYDLKEPSEGIWFMPNGQFMVLKSASDTVSIQYEFVIRDAATGALVKTLPNRVDTTSQVVFSPDGQSFFVIPPAGGRGGAAGPSPSGIYVIVSQGEPNDNFSLRDINTGEIIRSFPTLASNVLPRPDGQSFVSIGVTSSFVTSLDLWRLDTHESLVEFVCTNRHVPAFTADQRSSFMIKDETSVCAQQ